MLTNIQTTFSIFIQYIHTRLHHFICMLLLWYEPRREQQISIQKTIIQLTKTYLWVDFY